MVAKFISRAAMALVIVLTMAFPAIAQTPSQVGFWYKPTEPGWGVSIQHPVAAVLANAVFAATKQRLRALPLQLA